MKAVIRATGILASSSAVTVGVGMLSAKAMALLIGPGGVGRMGVLQGAAGLVAILAGMGIGNAVVRLGAGALASGDTREARALERAARLWSWGLGAVLALGFVLARRPLGRLVLGGPEHAWSAASIGLGVCFTVVAATQTGLLNAHHRVGALARTAIFTSLLGAVASIAIVWRWREAGVPLAVLAVLGAGCLVSGVIAARELPRHDGDAPARDEVRRAGGRLIRFGAPLMASALVGSGMHLLLPLLVMRSMDAESVGYFRAATTLSVGYLGFLLTAMGQDYYPRISAAQSPAEMRELANVQIRLVNLVGVPVILFAQLASPFLVPLLYAPSFAPAVEILRWQWLGDLFKLWSWALSFVVLAHSGSRSFFLLELVGGTALLVCSVGGMRLFGLPGLGMGYLATLVVYSAAAWAMVRRQTGFGLTPANVRMMVVALAASLAVAFLSGGPVAGAGFLAAAAVVLAMGAGCLAVLWKETGRGLPRLGAGR